MKYLEIVLVVFIFGAFFGTVISSPKDRGYGEPKVLKQKSLTPNGPRLVIRMHGPRIVGTNVWEKPQTPKEYCEYLWYSVGIRNTHRPDQGAKMNFITRCLDEQVENKNHRSK
jgi:hypothetical protein